MGNYIILKPFVMAIWANTWRGIGIRGENETGNYAHAGGRADTHTHTHTDTKMCVLHVTLHIQGRSSSSSSDFTTLPFLRKQVLRTKDAMHLCVQLVNTAVLYFALHSRETAFSQKFATLQKAVQYSPPPPKESRRDLKAKKPPNALGRKKTFFCSTHLPSNKCLEFIQALRFPAKSWLARRCRFESSAARQPIREQQCSHDRLFVLTKNQSISPVEWVGI